MPPSRFLFRGGINGAFTPSTRCRQRSFHQISPLGLLRSPRSRTYVLNKLDTSFCRSLHRWRRGHPNTLSNFAHNSYPSSSCSRSRPTGSALFACRFNSTNGSSTAASFSQRLRKLSSEYGRAALGVYLLLSALDFPFCFAAVRLLGVERIGHYEHVIVEAAKRVFGPIWPRTKEGNDTGDLETGDLAMASSTEGSTFDHGVVEAQQRNAEDGASIWTQLALAYAIHKSFIFIRVPLTAAVTPKVVRVLRGWGWNIGKRRPKSG